MKEYLKILLITIGTSVLLMGSMWFIINTANAESVLFPLDGGTGTGDTPSYGNILVGNSGGTYTLTATSSLGIGSSVWTDFGSYLQPTNGEGLIINASSTNVGDFTVTGQTLGSVGSVSAPGFSFQGDANTGFYRTTGAIRISVGGVNSGRWTSAGVQAIDGSAGTPSVASRTDSDTGLFWDTDQLGFTTGGTERGRFDASGNFGVATDTPSHTLSVNGSALFNGDLNLANLYATGTGRFDTNVQIASTTNSLSSVLEVGGRAFIGGDTFIASGEGLYIGGVIQAGVGISALQVDCDLLLGFGSCVFGDPDAGTYAYFRHDGDLQFIGGAGYFVEPNTYAFQFDSTIGTTQSPQDLGLYFDGAGGDAGYQFLGSQGLGNPLFHTLTNLPGTIIRDAIHLTSVFQVATTTIYQSGDADFPGIAITTGLKANASTTPTEPFTVVPRSFFNDTVRIVGTTTSDMLSVENNGGDPVFRIDQHGHQYVENSGGTPTLSACGTSPSLIGDSNDTMGVVQVGTGGTATSCTITFADAYETGKTVACQVTPVTFGGTSRITRASSTISSVLVTVNAAWSANDRFAYECKAF